VEVGERLLAHAWKRHLIGAGAVVTDSGRAVSVIHPGRENRDRGPDFVDAIVCGPDGEVVRGDVEIHRRTSDWRRHGHDRDPHYDAVILQVVWRSDGEAVARSGRRITTLSLSDVLQCSPDGLRRRLDLQAPRAEPCADTRGRLGEAEVGRRLDEAGEERFRAKARSFAARLRGESPAEVLYQGVMRALGYSKNAAGFEELARRLPLALLDRAARGKPIEERTEVLEALLLGKAGLLPPSAGDGLWRIWRREGDGEPMPASCWRRFRVRPENQPAQRLAGAARLLARFMETGLLEGVLGCVAAAAAGTDTIERRFTVGAEGRAADSGRCLIGRGRARETVVNIVLPFAFAWAESGSRPGMARQALALYRGCPKTGEYGATRDLGRLLAGDRASKVVNTALRQQGLVHIDSVFCRPRECAVCPFGR
jgi:hypothetical protein